MKKEEKQVKQCIFSKSWAKSLIEEIARDSLALGSIPMFIIVAARTTLADNYKFLLELAVAGIFILIFSFFFKSQNHLSRAIVLYIFTVLFYSDNRYTIFATLLMIIILISLFYLKYPKKQILFGVISGLISSGISYFVFENLITSIQNY